jgi:hypothetical protein
MSLDIGSMAMTPLGSGRVVGRDLPESKAWRWIVEVDGKELCFFPKEVRALRRQLPGPDLSQGQPARILEVWKLAKAAPPSSPLQPLCLAQYSYPGPKRICGTPDAFAGYYGHNVKRQAIVV